MMRLRHTETARHAARSGALTRAIIVAIAVVSIIALPGAVPVRSASVGIADELDSRCNIMIRDGVYCVHSYFNRIYGQGWSQPRLPHEHRMTYRISLYFYNTLQECDTFLETLDEIFKERSYI